MQLQMLEHKTESMEKNGVCMMVILATEKQLSEASNDWHIAITEMLVLKDVEIIGVQA